MACETVIGFYGNFSLIPDCFHACMHCTTFACPSTRRCSSGVEQLIRNEQVVGSNPTSGSRRFGSYYRCVSF